MHVNLVIGPGKGHWLIFQAAIDRLTDQSEEVLAAAATLIVPLMLGASVVNVVAVHLIREMGRFVILAIGNARVLCRLLCSPARLLEMEVDQELTTDRIIEEIHLPGVKAGVRVAQKQALDPLDGSSRNDLQLTEHQLLQILIINGDPR